MHPDTSSINQDYFSKDSMSYFRKYILLQNGVSSDLLIKKDDSDFIKGRINSEKSWHTKGFTKSVLASHQLKTSYVAPKEKELIIQVWMPWVILICFIFFAIARYSYYRRMQQLLKSFFSNRLFIQLAREGGLFLEGGSLLMFISYLTGLSLFIYKIYDFYYAAPSSFFESALFYFKIFLVVLLLYFSKFFIYRLCGHIFGYSKEIYFYVLNMFIQGQIASVLLLPVIIFAAYMNSLYVIFFGLFLLMILYVFSLFRSVLIIISGVNISPYYLFVYFCTLEFLPLLILAKILGLI